MYDELADIAVGGTASQAASDHLRECAVCVAELERYRVLARRMDAAVNALVRSQPPSRLLQRVTARAGSAERPQPSRGAWPGVAVGAALAASVIALMFGLRAPQPPMTPDADAGALAAWRSPTSALLKPHGIVLEAPLHDAWFNVEPRPSRLRTYVWRTL